MSKFNFTKDEESDFFQIMEFRNRVSDFLVSQLRCFLDGECIHTSAIVDEIRFLEGLADRPITKKAKRFRRGKLRGFWHTHFANGDLSEQAKNYMKMLDKPDAIGEIFREIVSETNDIQEISRKMADSFVYKQYENIRNTKSWTGNWIIYKNHNGANYYLMIVVHPKSGEDTDPIYDDMVELCKSQFPFLFD